MPTRRQLLTAAAAAAVAPRTGGAAVADRRYRNVLLLIADDWSAVGGCYGTPEVKTPHIDAFAARGTRFDQAFCVTPSCAASRGTILTGHYPHTNGQYGHSHAPHNLHTLPNMPSIPKTLKAHGFATACIGKLHVLPPEVYPWDFEAGGGRPGGNRNVQGMAERIGEFLARYPDQPFYCHVGYGDPHRDFGNGPNYPGVTEVKYDPAEVHLPGFLPDHPAVRAELAEYYQSVSRFDQGIGMALRALEQSGRAAETLVIVMSDHGMPFPGAKASPYDSGHRCPLMIHAPGQRAGLVNEALVNWCNLAPTVFDWCGVPAPDGLPERSLLPILETEQPDGWDECFYSHTFHEITNYYPYRSLRGRKYKYQRVLYPECRMPLPSDLWRSTTWRAIEGEQMSHCGARRTAEMMHHAAEELYDIEADPLETTNLADQPALRPVLESMRRRVQEFRRATADPWVLASIQLGEEGLGSDAPG